MREAIDDGHDLIILGGGDGTVSSVAGILAESDVVLGLLPLGTANDFARTLNIPFELEKACATVANGAVAQVDLGRAGSNYFVNVASIGLGSAVAEALSPRLKHVVGSLAYPVAGCEGLHGPGALRGRYRFPGRRPRGYRPGGSRPRGRGQRSLLRWWDDSSVPTLASTIKPSTYTP